MAKMADTKITIDNSGNQIKHSTGPATVFSPPSTAQPIAITSAGSRNEVHGQILTGGVVYGPVFDNPGR